MISRSRARDSGSQRHPPKPTNTDPTKQSHLRPPRRGRPFLVISMVLLGLWFVGLMLLALAL